MSLSATLASNGMRPASFLPTIKCSSCGYEIEISAMGEHLCGKAAQASTSAHSSMSSATHSSVSSNFSNAFSMRQANANAPSQPSPLQFSSGQPPQTRIRAPTLSSSSQMSPPKPPRTAPPRVNTDVANQPFLAPSLQMDTPISPALSSRSGSDVGTKPLPPLRSMTSPMPRLWDPRPPSPELSANLDCAFPPFPTSATTTSRPGTSNGRRTPSERGSSRNGSRPELHNTEPRSPVSNAGENVTNRMNTLKNGPFDPSRRRPSNDERAQRELKEMKRRPSLPARSFNRNAPSPPPQLPQLPKTESDSSEPVKDTPSAANGPALERTQAAEKQPPGRPERPWEDLSPAFLNQQSSEPASNHQASKPPAPMRSMTTPAPLDRGTGFATLPPLTKVASEPVRRPDTAPSDNSSPESSSIPPRSQSRNPGRIDPRMQDAPPVPKSVQLHRSDSKHKPSGSGSSTASSVPSLGNSDSGASPVGSATSSVDVLSPLSYQVGRDSEEKDMRPAGLNVKSQQKPGMRAEQPKERSPPPRNFTRPSPPKDIALPAALPPATSGSSSWPLESPMDPAMRNQRVGDPPESPVQSEDMAADQVTNARLAPAFSIPSTDDYDPYRSPSPQPSSTEPQRRAPLRSQTDAYPQSSHAQRPQSPFRSKTDTDVPSSSTQQPRNDMLQMPNLPEAPPIPQDAPRPSLQRQPTTGAKPKCRGCNLKIEGKSVKAADGGLTGRWHKACFVCKTCREPFTTSDFYVINNHPYCEQHYHEKNGSVCNGCHKGIEGQYLETTSSGPNGRIGRKYHRRCFTCVDCRTVLSDDYFEIGGRVFCERHALANMRGQARPPGAGPPGLAPHGGSNLKAERRRTRLMNM